MGRDLRSRWRGERPFRNIDPLFDEDSSEYDRPETGRWPQEQPVEEKNWDADIRQDAEGNYLCDVCEGALKDEPSDSDEEVWADFITDDDRHVVAHAFCRPEGWRRA